MSSKNSTSMDFHPITLIAVCFAGLFFSSFFILIMIFLRRCKFRQGAREETDSSSHVHVHALVKEIPENNQQKILPTNSETTTELISIIDSADGGGEFGQVKDLESGMSEEEGSTGTTRQNIGWGRWYTLDELSVATRNFAIGNVVGEGGYGIVYHGVLPDSSAVAVKKLLDNNKYVSCVLELCI